MAEGRRLVFHVPLSPYCLFGCIFLFVAASVQEEAIAGPGDGKFTRAETALIMSAPCSFVTTKSLVSIFVYLGVTVFNPPFASAATAFKRNTKRLIWLLYLRIPSVIVRSCAMDSGQNFDRCIYSRWLGWISGWPILCRANCNQLRLSE